MPAHRTRDTQAPSRPLEVNTDAPQPPTLTIISPTPRTFTFPISHNLSDSPYSSPCSSPFEPDLRPLALSSTISTCTPPPLIRTLSPIDSTSSSSPTTHKRRKSSTSDDVERRPKKGDEDYIKRPENAFILFRRKCCEERQQAQEEAAADGPTKKQRQADLSKTISQQWKSLPPEERSYWEQLAKEKKKEHEQKFPNYVYRPQRVRDKDGKARNKKSLSKRRATSELDHDTDSESVSFVLPMPRHHGRSASAPTPPPTYQSIHVPFVRHVTPSCPTSPSLLPMISRRSSHTGNPEDVMSNFDYCPPSNSLAPASFGQGGCFETNLPSSDLLRSMFDLPSRHPAPLNLSQDSMLLPAHQIISPGSSISSGPSSPRTGPFTPTSGFSANFPSPLSDLSALAPSISPDALSSSAGFQFPQPHQQACSGGEPIFAQNELDLQIEMQLQQDMEYANDVYAGYPNEYSGSTYPTPWDSIWSPESDVLLVNDFDVNAIPPLQLHGSGDGKFMQEQAVAQGMGEIAMEEYDLQHQQDGSQGLLGFDEMMAGHSF